MLGRVLTRAPANERLDHMDYPVWHVPYFGGAMVIASIAIVHVFIAQFAVGAGVFNALAETFALRRRDDALRRFLRDNSRLIILLPFIGGVITGVGIFFSITLVSPESTALLVHLFLWAWAIEWVFFLVEIVAGYMYYYTWDRFSPRTHCLIGWIYALAAVASLVVINGIISFMLTPGQSLDSSTVPMRFDFWQGLFNPTFAPSLVMRGLGSLALAALFALVLVNASRKYSPQDRHRLTQLAARCLWPLVFMIPAAVWFFLRCPPQALGYLRGGAIALVLLLAFGVTAFVLIGLYSYVALILRRRRVSLETALLLLALAFIALGASEFVREGMRKPYLIWDHVYGNGIFKNQVPRIEQALQQDRPLRVQAVLAGDSYAGPWSNDTVLRFHPWAVKPQMAETIPLVRGADALARQRGLSPQRLPGAFIGPDHLRIPDKAFYTLEPELFAHRLRDVWAGKVVRGRWLYDAQCLRCHSLDGYNAVRPLVRNWSPEMLSTALENLPLYRGFMPPFVGSPIDRTDLSYYLHQLNGSCSRCHTNLNDQGDRLNTGPIETKPDWKPLP